MTLTPKKYRKTIINDTIKSYLKTFGAINIEGPKWYGKTWSVKNVANSEFQFNTNNIKLLKIDKKFAFRRSDGVYVVPITRLGP